MIGWDKALSCYSDYGENTEKGQQFYECFREAMVQHDLYYRSGIKRENWGKNRDRPKIDIYTSKPKVHWINLKQSGQCVGIVTTLYSKRTNGAQIELQDCNDTKAQKWHYDTLGRLKNQFSGRCLEFGNKNKLYAKAFQWNCNNGKHQQWDQLSNGKYRNKAFSSKFLGVAYCGTRNGYKLLEAKNYVQTGVCNCGQTWNRSTCN